MASFKSIVSFELIEHFIRKYGMSSFFTDTVYNKNFGSNDSLLTLISQNSKKMQEMLNIICNYHIDYDFKNLQEIPFFNNSLYTFNNKFENSILKKTYIDLQDFSKSYDENIEKPLSKLFLSTSKSILKKSKNSLFKDSSDDFSSNNSGLSSPARSNRSYNMSTSDLSSPNFSYKMSESPELSSPTRPDNILNFLLPNRSNRSLLGSPVSRPRSLSSSPPARSNPMSPNRSYDMLSESSSPIKPNNMSYILSNAYLSEIDFKPIQTQIRMLDQFLKNEYVSLKIYILLDYIFSQLFIFFNLFYFSYIKTFLTYYSINTDTKNIAETNIYDNFMDNNEDLKKNSFNSFFPYFLSNDTKKKQCLLDIQIGKIDFYSFTPKMHTIIFALFYNTPALPKRSFASFDLELFENIHSSLLSCDSNFINSSFKICFLDDSQPDAKQTSCKDYIKYNQTLSKNGNYSSLHNTDGFITAMTLIYKLSNNVERLINARR